jgi:hypothetical protein
LFARAHFNASCEHLVASLRYFAISALVWVYP